LHWISGSGQGAHCAAGHAGHAFGSGHLTTGQRGRGQGGHSPILQGLEQVEIQGGHFGTDDLSTYFDISGSGGHSVLSMYLDISGRGGHGGTADFFIHLDISGVGHDGQGGQRSRAAYGIPIGDELDPASAPPLTHPQGFGLRQRSQTLLAQPQGRGLWQRSQMLLVAAALGQSGADGMSKPLSASFAQPQGVFPQRLHVLPPANFSSTTFPLTLPIR